MRVSGLSPAAGRNGTDGRFAAYKSKKRGQKKGRKKYAPNKQKERKRKNKRKKSVLQIQKRRHKEAWPCGRAASGRVTWRGALKKYAPKPEQNLLPRIKYAQEPKRKGKKRQKRGIGGPKAPA